MQIEQKTGRQRSATIGTFPRVNVRMKKKTFLSFATTTTATSERNRERKNLNAKYLYKYAIFALCIEWKRRK